MLARQNGRCASCKIRPAETLCVDHCHRTGMVRGLLCRKCNTGLGCFNDSPALLHAAAAYLRRHAARAMRAWRPATGPALASRLRRALRPAPARPDRASGASAPSGD